MGEFGEETLEKLKNTVCQITKGKHEIVWSGEVMDYHCGACDPW